MTAVESRSPVPGTSVTLALLLVCLAAAAWGTTGTTLRLIGAASGFAPLLVGASRMAVGAPLLVGSALRWDQGPRRLGWAGLGAGACIAAYQACYFSAVPRAGVAATALLAICSAPLLVALLARLLLGERLTAARALCLLGGVAGAGLLIVGASGGAAPDIGLGAPLALGAGLSYALYVVLTKGRLGQVGPLWMAAGTFSVAAVALLPALLLLPGATISLWRHGALGLLYLGVVPTAAAYWIYTWSLARVPAVAATVVGLVEPLVATLLAAALFGERLGLAGAAGAALLLASVFALARGTPATPATEPHIS